MALTVGSLGFGHLTVSVSARPLSTSTIGYYDHLDLQRVRTEGAWLRFFLERVRLTANQAVDAARKILALFEKDRAMIGQLGRSAGSALQVHEELQRHLLLTPRQAEQTLPLSKPTVLTALGHLEDLGIVREMTGKERYRRYLYEGVFRDLGGRSGQLAGSGSRTLTLCRCLCAQCVHTNEKTPFSGRKRLLSGS